MPVNLRKDGKSKQIALDVLGPSLFNEVDKFGKIKKKRRRKKENKKWYETFYFEE
jgi:hypothetical protein